MTITATTNADLVPRIRHALEEAQRAGRRPPGRPALHKLTGATDHAIKTALQKINDEHSTTRDSNHQAPPAPGLTTTASRHTNADGQPWSTSTSTASSHQDDADLNDPAGGLAPEPSPEHQATSPPPNRGASVPSAGAGDRHSGISPARNYPPASPPHGPARPSTDPGDAGCPRRIGANTSPAITSTIASPTAAAPPARSTASTRAPTGVVEPPAPRLQSPGATSPAGTPPASAEAGAKSAGGQAVAWAGFAFGSIMSIAANVLHTWLPPANEPPGWSPGLGPQIGAAVWPIGLLLSVEILSRVRWPHTWPWALARYGGAGTVTLGSALISYMHLHGLLLAWGYDSIGAAVGPLVLDGLMTISGFALLANSRAPMTGNPCRQWAEPSTNDQCG
jgi:hypothetical protein